MTSKIHGAERFKKGKYLSTNKTNYHMMVHRNGCFALVSDFQQLRKCDEAFLHLNVPEGRPSLSKAVILKVKQAGRTELALTAVVSIYFTKESHPPTQHNFNYKTYSCYALCKRKSILKLSFELNSKTLFF